MVTESMMYWITRLDNFVALGGAIIGIALIGIFLTTVVSIAIKTDWIDDKIPTAIKLSLAASILAFIFGISVVTFVPTTKEYCAIKVIPAIANNSDVRNIGKDLKTLAEKWVEKQIKELDNADK